jgi:signal peptidase I
MPVQSQIVVDADHGLKCQLLIQALRSYGHVSLRVTGTSMWPALRPGDKVDIRAAQFDEVKIGALAAFSRHERIFVHRIVRKSTIDGRAALITRGDALPAEDPPVLESEFLGMAQMVDRLPRSFLSWLREAVQYRLLPPVLERIRS